MDYGNSNRNAHYANRSGRNMSSGMNAGRNRQGSTMQSRNGCGCVKDMRRDEYVGGCDRGMEPVDEMMPGMGFVPWQKWEDVYSIEDGLENGTIFAQLNKPYIGRPMK